MRYAALVVGGACILPDPYVDATEIKDSIAQFVLIILWNTAAGKSMNVHSIGVDWKVVDCIFNKCFQMGFCVDTILITMNDE